VHAPVVSRSLSRWIISVLLVALCVRALVPAGFMPSADRPFSFQICPDGFPAELLKRPAPAAHSDHAGHAHHQMGQAADPEPQTGSSHEHGAVRAEHCVFAAVASAGPVPDTLLLGTAIEAQQPPSIEPPSRVLATARFQLPQSRAPPTLS
jgi:hypothetical protein